ncbi:MAG: flavodoxin [Candidatus Pararuminococcus gallinarum]|jgi:flavodoxin
MKNLILYYSYGGNTRRIAKLIQETIGGNLAEIHTTRPYTGSYMEVVDQGQQEISSGYMPEIEPLSVNPSDYDQIILGSPVWWYTFAPAIKTFLSQYDLSGKVVCPFSTNGGWPGHLLKDVKKACKGADVKKGMDIRFEGSSLLTEEKEIVTWIQSVLK